MEPGCPKGRIVGIKHIGATCAVTIFGMAFASCGGDGGSDSSGAKLPASQISKIENTLKDAASDPGEEDWSASCPSGVQAKKDETFDCKVARRARPEASGTLKVTLLDAKGADITYEGRVGEAKITGRQTPYAP